MLKAFFRFSFLVILLVACLSVNGQVPPQDPPDPQDIPVTGFEWLLLGGAAVGAKKIYDARRKQQ